MEAETVGIGEQPAKTDMEYDDGGDDELSLKDGDLRALRRGKRIISQLTKPSTTLLLGSKGNFRHRNCIRLRYLLDKLVKRRNWGDAAGVLSVLLTGTCKERSLHDNRIKYLVAKELLEHVGSDREHSNDIEDNLNKKKKDVEDIYNLWLKKIVPKKNRSWKDRQDREADYDPISNLMLGLCYYELWYATLPADRQLIDIHEPEMLDETEDSGIELHNVVESSLDYHAVSIQDTNSSFIHHSETSVMGDKVIQMDNTNRKDSVAYADKQRVTTHHQSQGQGLYLNSDQTSGSEGGSLMKRNINMQSSSAFYSHVVPDSLLFPIQWDPLNENIEDVIKDLQPNDDYRDAVQCLRKALNSTPGVAEALLPLVQILLLMIV